MADKGKEGGKEDAAGLLKNLSHDWTRQVREDMNLLLISLLSCRSPPAGFFFFFIHCWRSAPLTFSIRRSSPYRATPVSRACRARIFNRIAAAALCPARLDFPPTFNVSASRVSPIRRRDLPSSGSGEEGEAG